MSEREPSGGGGKAPALAELLVRHRGRLAAWIAREGSGLLKFESCEDLVQGVCEHALRVASRFEFRGEERFVAWLFEVARQRLADRNRYWSAFKRGSARVLRLTWTGLSDTAGGRERVPSSTATGPATVAARREQLALAARALALLSERDRKLVRWLSEGVAIEEQAQRLELSADSTRRASSRALERFRKTFEAIGGRGGATRAG